MQHTGISRLSRCAIPMPYPLTYARGSYQTREALLVKVHDRR